jgi:hypothetical protein
VPSDSAVLPGYTSIGIHYNHMDMTKFGSEDDEGFIAVTGELRRWLTQERAEQERTRTITDQERLKAILGTPPPCYTCHKEAVIRAGSVRNKSKYLGWDTLLYHEYFCDRCGRRTLVGAYR